MGRGKAFNTCATHLTIISISSSISIFIYVTPSQKETLQIHKKVPAVLTSIVCPLLNPLIFTLKNDMLVKQALTDMLTRSRELAAQKVRALWKKKRCCF